MPVAKNILLLMTDQHQERAVSWKMGHAHIHTPALDALAAKSLVFNRAYCPSPVCVPARNSIFTGLYPHQTQIECNRYHPRSRKPAAQVTEAFLPGDTLGIGSYFGSQGFETAYFGKWHINMAKDAKAQHGFNTTGVLELKGHDTEVAEATAGFLRGGHAKPFFAVCSFSDPHDVCQLADGRPLPGGPLPTAPPVDSLPTLPENMGPGLSEPEILRQLREAYYQVHGEQKNDSEQARRRCRELAWGYYRLVERVDALIDTVLVALADAGLADDTMVMYTSDHGELLGAHGLVQKTFFYEEATRVPLYMCLPWLPSAVAAPEHAESSAGLSTSSDALVHVGVDLLPTLLEATGLPIPEALPGRSLLPHATLPGHARHRDCVVGQVHFCSPKMPEETPKTYGRMVRSDQYNYWLLDHGEDREILFDTRADPGETTNLSLGRGSAPILQAHRDYLRRHAAATDDIRAMEMLRGVESESVGQW